MQRYEDVATPMHQNIRVLSGNIEKTLLAKPKQIFDATVIDFLNEISSVLLKDSKFRIYKDLISIGFFLRKSSIEKLRQDYLSDNKMNRMGVGLVFHVTPSNIPVQFFYSLSVSLLAGNSNIVRVSKNEYEQSRILYQLIDTAFEKYPEMQDYICLINYGHEKDITDFLSQSCDARIIWGGDSSIDQIRMSSLPPRSFDVTFADRFSLSIINSEKYLALSSSEQQNIAEKFYVDTYFSDQNACNSTRLVIWIGEEGEPVRKVNMESRKSQIDGHIGLENGAFYPQNGPKYGENGDVASSQSDFSDGLGGGNDYCMKASKCFWNHLFCIVKNNYILNGTSVIDKLVDACSFAIRKDGHLNYECSYGNYINVIDVRNLSDDISIYKGSCGYFLQVYIETLDDFVKYVKKDWQTITYFGIDPFEIYQLLSQYGVKGIDRIVPIGSSGIPSLKWDGIDFIERLSRNIDII